MNNPDDNIRDDIAEMLEAQSAAIVARAADRTTSPALDGLTTFAGAAITAIHKLEQRTQRLHQRVLQLETEAGGRS